MGLFNSQWNVGVRRDGVKFLVVFILLLYEIMTYKITCQIDCFSVSVRQKHSIICIISCVAALYVLLDSPLCKAGNDGKNGPGKTNFVVMANAYGAPVLLQRSLSLYLL